MAMCAVAITATMTIVAIAHGGFPSRGGVPTATAGVFVRVGGEATHRAIGRTGFAAGEYVTQPTLDRGGGNFRHTPPPAVEQLHFPSAVSALDVAQSCDVVDVDRSGGRGASSPRRRISESRGMEIVTRAEGTRRARLDGLVVRAIVDVFGGKARGVDDDALAQRTVDGTRDPRTRQPEHVEDGEGSSHVLRGRHC